MNRSVLPALLAGLIVFSLPAAAQDAAPAQVLPAAPAVTAPAQTPPATAEQDAAPDPLAGDDMAMQDTEVTVMKDNYADAAYVTPSMQNLSRLYWRLGIFHLEDKKAIDNFLIINECDIYQNFFKDDFEWANVRASTREMLKEKSPAFSNQFKILVPIDLGRYDMERGGFDLVNKTAFVNSRRVQVTGSNMVFNECGQKGDLPGYPSQVVMILNKPFTFNFVKVDEHVAQAFLLRKKYNNTPMPRELRNKGFQRLAYARMRVTLVRFQGMVDEIGGRSQAILYGKLDGIDVFEDPKEEMLLTSVNYQ